MSASQPQQYHKQCFSSRFSLANRAKLNQANQTVAIEQQQQHRMQTNQLHHASDTTSSCEQQQQQQQQVSSVCLTRGVLRPSSSLNQQS
jgi:hypothetical protein